MWVRKPTSVVQQGGCGFSEGFSVGMHGACRAVVLDTLRFNVAQLIKYCLL